ncbi:hypothetical protein [Ammoniphilus sp. YIM 78166]|uniref:hypothetical protein n=1 Tax=Ammoniphilus sp. YIM 78166 TaxID=1644106 RepID=UPI0010700AB1|nr:hypothetical protein [Ammoniphilus sp. YIM 78166]
MKKLVSLSLAGFAVLVMATSGLASTTHYSGQAVAFEHPHGHKAHIQDNQELLRLLKMDGATLHQELKAGKSLTDIAAAQGVEKQKVIDLLLNEASSRIDEAVKEGKITQEQANEKKAYLGEHIPKHVEQKGWLGHKGKGHKHKGHHYIEDTATLLGMKVDELRAKLKEGKSLVEIAAEKGISKEELIEKLSQKHKERLAEMVEKKWTGK